MQILAAAAGAGLSVPTITSVAAAYQKATVTFGLVAGATSYTVTAVGSNSTSGTTSPLLITGLTNYASYYFTVTATDGSTSVTSAQFGPVTVAVPCTAGTYQYTSAESCGPGYPSFGGACCSYPIVCDGNGGLTSGCANGPCSVSTGYYCAGCCGPT